MQRVAFMLRVRMEKLPEYKKLHNPIWPEMAAALRSAGIRNYTLWLGPDGLEFGYLECEDWDETCKQLEQSEVHTRWQEMMQDYLLTPTDNSQGNQPVEMLQQVMLLD